MIQVRKAVERGHFDHGWLDTYHTFSFGDYYDPTGMGFRSLQVINDDRVQPGRGFGTHGHRDKRCHHCPGGSPPAHCTTGTVKFRIAPSR
jgi:redox-sensitive bicupin YhaK (pirin superfamily)